MSLETSASESGEKDVNECMFAGKMCLTVCGVENCAVRFVILLMKNVAKSSAVRVESQLLPTRKALGILSPWLNYILGHNNAIIAYMLGCDFSM